MAKTKLEKDVEDLKEMQEANGEYYEEEFENLKKKFRELETKIDGHFHDADGKPAIRCSKI